MSSELRPQFWKKYPLEALNPQEWEALCDGCGLCCLVKLEDEDTHEVAYTKVACKLLDCSSARCSNYPERLQYVPDCIQLTPEKLEQIQKNDKEKVKKCNELGIQLVQIDTRDQKRFTEKSSKKYLNMILNYL